MDFRPKALIASIRKKHTLKFVATGHAVSPERSSAFHSHGCDFRGRDERLWNCALFSLFSETLESRLMVYSKEIGYARI